jgi:glycosyltransferase involved in cell wall biosynthesis
MKRYCFIIPVKEDLRVINRVANLLSKANNYGLDNFEVIIVQDDDISYEIDRSLLPKNCSLEVKKNPGKIGKGSAVRYGLSQSTADIHCILDSDESLAIEDIFEACLKYREGHLLSGVRLYENSTEKIRRILGMVQNILANLFSLEFYVQDTQCPLKIIDNSILDIILRNLTIDGGMYDVQLLKIIQKNGIPLILYPVIRIDGDISVLRLRNIIFGDFIDLIRIRFSKYD